jgi:hypothetical protein
MGNKLALIFIMFLLLGTSCFSSGKVSVGVKKGDWIEYTVSTTGAPEEGHDVTWARMEIVDVQGSEIKANLTTKARNGTLDSLMMTLNPEEGNVGIWFIIPADLSVGEAFYDAEIDKNVTVEGSEQRTIADATRTVTHASTPERVKSWDKTTGVFVESVDTLQNYTLHAIAERTNLWNPQILGVDANVFIGATIAAVIIAVTVTVFNHTTESKWQIVVTFQN